MRSAFKIALLATTCLIGGTYSLAAETATVVLNDPSTVVVGVTADGTVVAAQTTFVIVPTQMTEAELAAVNSPEGIENGPSPGPYFGWAVLGSDLQKVGMLTFSVQDKDGIIEYLQFQMADGRGMRITNGISAMRDHVITLRLTKDEVMLNATNGFSNISIE